MHFRTRVGINLVIASLLPLLLAMGLALWFSKEQTLVLSLDQANSRLQVAADSIDHYFVERKNQVAAYANYPSFKVNAFPDLLPYLRDEVGRHKGTYEKFILGVPTGHFLNTVGGNPDQGFVQTFNNSEPNATPKSISKRDYWQKTVGHNIAGNPVVYVSNPMISYTTGVRQIVVAATILDEKGLTRGLIGGSLSWESFKNLVSDIQLNLVSAYKNSGFALVSNDGTYWSHWDSSKVISLKRDAAGNIVKTNIGEADVVTRNIRNESDIELRNIGSDIANHISSYQLIKNEADGTNDYYIYRSIPSSGYGLIMVISEQELLAPVHDLLMIFFWVIGGTIFLILLLSFDLASRLSAPLNRLKEATIEFETLGKSEFHLESSIEEFRDVGQAFRSMAATIRLRSKELSTSEERLSLAMKGTTDGLWDWDRMTDDMFFSDRWKSMLGYGSGEIEHTFTAFEQLIHPDDVEKVLKAINSYINDECAVFEVEFRILHKDQNYLMVLSRGHAVRDSQGRVLRMVGTHVDITEREKI